MNEVNERLLVVRIGALGDVADTTVAVSHIKNERPHLKIDWVVKNSFAPIVTDFCDRVIPISSLNKGLPFLRELRQHKYVAAVDFHGNFRSALIAYLSRSATRYGFSSSNSREGASFFYTHRLSVPSTIQSRIQDGLDLASLFLNKKLDYTPLEFVENHEDAQFAEDLLRNGHDIVLATSSSPKGFHKMWPQERWRSFIEKSPKTWKFTLIWGPGEEGAVKAVAQGYSDRVQVTAPTKLKQLESIIKRSRLVIGGDTGPMHMAHLLDIPTIVLFGPKDPRRYGPQFNQFRVIYEKQICSPCRNWRCDHISCMWAINTDSVVQAAQELLEGVS